VIACRYNVRETGFVDLGRDPYLFIGYVNDETPAKTLAEFEQISDDMLMDSNIEVEIINITQQKDHPARQYIDIRQTNLYPAAVLISPDGQSRVVPVTKPNQPFDQTLRFELNRILSSPKRDELKAKVIKHYAVVLLLEGTDVKENKRAREAAIAAIEKINKKMDMMPKPIKYPPVIVTIDASSLSRETILLWSLGLDVDSLESPHVAVFYGRSRWIGPLFKGEQITKDFLSEILFVVGADCECGLDQTWLQGTMIPASWDKNAQIQIAENLGFDPENPMIKVEISRIIRMGSHSQGMTDRSSDLLNEEDSIHKNQPVMTYKNGEGVPAFSNSDSVVDEAGSPESESLLKKSMSITVISLVLLFIGAMIIVLRKRFVK
jgi:hypothetical protein